MKIIKRIIACCVLCSFTSSVLSMEYQYSLYTSVTGSDNITRATDGVSGHSLNTGLSFQVRSLADSEWRVDFSGDYSNEFFSEDNLDSRRIQQVIGSFEYLPQASNFSVLLLQELSQESRNRFSTDSVNNLRDTKTHSFIPSYFLQLNALNRINLNYVYTDSRDEGVETDAGVYDGSRVTKEYALSYERQLTSTQRFFIGANSSRIDFSELLLAGAVDFDQDDIFARWIIQGSATQIQILYGLSTIFDVLGNEIETNMSEFSINRQINQTHSIEFNYSTGFDSELGENFSTDTVNLDSQTANFLSAQEVENYDFVYLINSVSGLNMNLRLFNSTISATLNDNQEKQNGFSFNLAYPISRIINSINNADIGISVERSNNTFDTSLSVVTENDTSVLSISYNQFISSSFSMFVELSSYKVDGDSFGSFEADSNLITIGFRYAPARSF